MTAPISARFHDGRSLAAREVELAIEDGSLHVLGLAEPFTHPLATVRVSDRLAHIPRFLYLSGGASIETADNDAIDALFANRGAIRRNGVIHWLEQRTRVAACATVLLVAGVGAAVKFGLPFLAHRGAHAVPVEVERRAGAVALNTLDQWFGPSELGPIARLRVTRQSDRLVRTLELATTPQLEFRAMGQFPNAFALPGGIVIVSDELVRIATDDELAAVIAHEFAHWQLRHGLQGLLRGSAALLLVCTVTGDLSTLTTFAAAIPVTLLQRGYSREFEEEADAFAIDALQRAGIDPRHLASVLAKLERSRGAGRNDFSYLSTHPATKDRIAKINPSGTTAPPRRLPFSQLLESKSKNRGNAAQGAAAPAANEEMSESDTPLTVADLVSRSQWPALEHHVAPVYPVDAYRAGRIGRVEIEFAVNRSGKVHSPRVLHTSSPEFDHAALAAAAKWRFQAAEGDERVSHMFTVNFAFEPEDTFSDDDTIVWATPPR